jgi:UDP-GlcNAc:undecaprenyl-phosphate GlcNAc-1-phosphate transferase
MAAATMVIGGRTPDVSGQTYFFFAPLFIPLFILGVPIADMAFAFVRRTAKGTGFHTPDKDHVHHRLLRLGHGPRRTVVILWAWTAVMSAFLLYPLFDAKGNAVIPFGVVVLGLALYTLFHPGLRKDLHDETGERPTERDAPTPVTTGNGRIAPGDPPVASPLSPRPLEDASRSGPTAVPESLAERK